ncbi:phospholipid carrier-dependent glycosyltransferase [Candidatus Collierbacteria bacterium]|nr:phospholipid carrier-dependent glycosyltransferase [Candidatus Collierbacteria bacterium]
MNKIKWLIAITILGSLLRFWGLGKNPPGLYWDEVSLGWNAYSVLKTGFDEHGRFLPIDTFFAFGDYKPPLYIYAVVPSIWIFGLNEFAVRFPSALAGTLLIIVTYLLTKELMGQKKRLALKNFDHQEDSTFNVQRTTHIALISAFLIAISPWSITLSRVGFESNLAVLLNALGFLFFLYAIRKSPKWLALSVFSFILAAYTFNANRLLSPIFLATLTIIYFRKAIINWKWWVVSVFVGIILAMPMFGHLRSPEGKLRWNEVNIFSNLEVIKESNSRIEVDGNTLIGRIFHHRYLSYARLFLGHYLEHFDLKYLFIQGDRNPRINIPDIGQMYLVELPFFILGLISLMKPMSLMATKEKLTLIFWFLLAAVPAGMARETPHALRSASTLPVPQIIIALGLMKLLSLRGDPIKSGRRSNLISKLLLTSYFLLLTFSLLYFQFIYWRYYQNEWAGEWLTSYKNLISYLRETGGPYRTIYVTSDLGRPYVYFLFYNQYDPKKYIQEAKDGGRTGDVFGFYNVNYFNKYKFYVPDLATIAPDELVVTRVDNPPSGFELLKTISDINGYPQFNVIKKQ